MKFSGLKFLPTKLFEISDSRSRHTHEIDAHALTLAIGTRTGIIRKYCQHIDRHVGTDTTE